MYTKYTDPHTQHALSCTFNALYTTDYTEWQRPLSCVHDKSARPPPFPLFTFTYKVAVYAPAERANTVHYLCFFSTYTMYSCVTHSGHQFGLIRDRQIGHIFLKRFTKTLLLCRISKSQLQLLGAACLFLSSKFKALDHISSDNLVMYTDYSITAQELKVKKTRE
jgi:hypothetical protein